MSKQYWMTPGIYPEDQQKALLEASNTFAIEEEKMKNHTFISMHELHDDAKIVYVSESVHDLLGYEPSELLGRSPFDFFLPESREEARRLHGKGVQMDKAAALTKWSLKKKSGEFIPCECVFTVVYSVVIAATSLLVDDQTFEKKLEKAQEVSEKFENRREVDAYRREIDSFRQEDELYRQEDRRGDMIRHLSSKFISPSFGQNEPRVALFLNRFTRSLCILYTTEAVTEMLGIAPRDMNGKSFLECIHEADIMRATDVIESAKDNNSIVYLRFQWRDPRDGHPNGTTNGTAFSNGNHFGSNRNGNNLTQSTNGNRPETNQNGSVRSSSSSGNTGNTGNTGNYKTSSEPVAVAGSSTRIGINSASNDYVTDDEDSDEQGTDGEDTETEEGVLGGEEEVGYEEHYPPPASPPMSQRGIWVECVISCTSDGLVAVLRKSRFTREAPEPAAFAPWAISPVLPNVTANDSGKADYMESIRQVAAFAWHCAPIYGEIRQFAKPNREFNYAEEEPRYGKSIRYRNGEGSTSFVYSSSSKTNGNGSERSDFGSNKRVKRSN